MLVVGREVLATMECNDYNRNVLLNILNILTRISDEDFIKSNWIENGLGESIVSSCREAILMLDDYQFFDIIHLQKDYFIETISYSPLTGCISNVSWTNFSKDYLDILPIAIQNQFGELAILIDNFRKLDDFDVNANVLLKKTDWIEIMQLSHIITVSLKKELDVKSDIHYLI